MSNFSSTGWTYVQGKIGYATSDYGPNLTGAFSIFDLSGSAPVLLGQINNDSRLEMAEGLQVCGRYAFVACMTGSVILVIDCGTLTAPVIVGSLADATNLYQCEALLLCGGYLLVSCDHQSAGLSNFTVVSVSSASPPVLAVVGTLANTSLYGAVYIDVQGKIAFVTCRNTTAGYGIVAAIDWSSNPATPSLLGTFGTSGGPFTGSSLGGSITGIDVWGQFAYVAASGVGGVVVLNVANPAAMTQVGTTFLSAFLTAISNVHLSGNLLQCSSYTAGLGTTVLDATNPAALLFVSNTPAITTAFQSDHMDLDGNHDFQADTSTGGGVALIDMGGFVVPTAHIGRLYVDDLHVGKDLRLARNLYLGGGMSPAPASSSGSSYSGPATYYNASSLSLNTPLGPNGTKPAWFELVIAVTSGCAVSVTMGPTSALGTPVFGPVTCTAASAVLWTAAFLLPPGWYFEVSVSGGSSSIYDFAEWY